MKSLEVINLDKLIKEKFIELDLEGNTKNEVIAGLAEVAARSPKLTNKKAFYKTMLEREELGSTGIGNGVAIPHVKSKVVRGFILIFARHNSGIDFGALDGEKTFLFFALASPPDKVGIHLKVLAEISRLVKDKFIVERLKKAKDKKEILKLLSSYKKEA
ncbi:MAG: PTS sugar transporter subunit IIA [Candidatus Omnitrophica bacterium]|nr:PTS sugar transporter subunit IIA [Candidatus Omnitrophota bacterium]